MAVPLAGRKPAIATRPKFGPTAGPWMPPKQAGKKPYNWAGAANINWFPGLNQPAPGGGFQPRPGMAGVLGPALQQMIGGGPRPQINLGNQYAGMIGGDYGVQEMESMMNARMGRAKGDFQSQIRQALIDLGISDKGKLGSLGQYIDADTITKAAENKYSQTAQIAQAEQRSRAQSEADLAARGLLSSGQLTTNAENILAEGEQGRYGALRDFLGAGQQGLTQLADMNEQYAMQLAQARADAAARAAEAQYYMGMNAYGDEGYGPAYATAMAAAPAAGPLSQRAWMAKHPGGVYQNYLNAFRRHQRQGY